jgi:hypothetical protein
VGHDVEGHIVYEADGLPEAARLAPTAYFERGLSCDARTPISSCGPISSSEGTTTQRALERRRSRHRAARSVGWRDSVRRGRSAPAPMARDGEGLLPINEEATASACSTGSAPECRSPTRPRASASSSALARGARTGPGGEQRQLSCDAGHENAPGGDSVSAVSRLTPSASSARHQRRGVAQAAMDAGLKFCHRGSVSERLRRAARRPASDWLRRKRAREWKRPHPRGESIFLARLADLPSLRVLLPMQNGSENSFTEGPYKKAGLPLRGGHCKF